MNKWFQPKQKEVEFASTYQRRFTSGDSKTLLGADASGIIYHFFFYAGQKCAGGQKCSASEVVLRLVEELLKNKNCQLFIDNWFSTLPLLSELKTMGILSIATFCSNHFGGCPLMSEKDLKRAVVVRSTIGRTTIPGHIC